MKTKSLFWCLIVLFNVASCSQNPVFFTISTETALKEAFIKGTPSNMVVFEREYPDPQDLLQTITVPILYIGAEGLHWYARNDYGLGDDSYWNNEDYLIPQPGGKIIQLATTKDHLYALCLTGSTRTVHRIGSNENSWTIISSHNFLLQSIYTDPSDDGRLFAGAGTGSSNNFEILYLNDSAAPSLELLKSGTAMLSGTAFMGGNHYLSTRGNGIFQVSEDDLIAGNTNNVRHLADECHLPDESNYNTHLFMGIIKLEDDTIIAVERNGGAFYKVDRSAVSYQQMKFDDDTVIGIGRYATGALTLWQSIIPQTGEVDRKILVVGKQGDLYSVLSSSLNGYVEFELNLTDGSLIHDSASRHDPPQISVEHNPFRYISTIGPIPINHLFQAPYSVDENMTFFASTYNAGLWSYRNLVDSGGWQWNAETD